MTANGGDRQRDVGIGAEEGKGQQPAAEYDVWQAPASGERTRRQQPPQRDNHRSDARGQQADPDEHLTGGGHPREARQSQASPRGSGDAVSEAVLGRPLAGRRCIVRRRLIEPEQSWQRQGAREDDQRDQPEEHHTPAEEAGDRCADRRADHAGQYPRGGQNGHHARPQILRQAPPYRDIRDCWHSPGSDALQGPAAHEYQHGRRSASDGQTSTEQCQATDEGPRRAIPVSLPSGGHDADHVAQHERAEDPAVEAQSA